MVESNLTWEAGLLMEEPSGNSDQETYLLAAALAAALVAYRQTTTPRSKNGYRTDSRSHWRMMARWGQLQSYL